ncbi:hypothetical protein KUH32_15025 [Thalassococcus sp. CAU 1522]|uniref:Uncharacterized protein n=1 Tax=Thalassococcus arenae TaxID=2851652 RepID=A0ABS6NAM8_9RHOB|nr:hypothetical protein [Thalassococcus arenae]MBV2361076.1 hypothetical protein [Thalassococcus arenae]
MIRTLFLIPALFALPLHAQDTQRQSMPSAYFALKNQGGAFDFDEADWRAAVAQASERVYWKIDRDPEMMKRVHEVAASVEGDAPFAWLFAVNLRPDQAAQFDILLDNLLENDTSGQFAGAEFVLNGPLCRVIRSADTTEGPIHYIAVVDGTPERSACYGAFIAQVLENPQDYQPVAPKQIAIDADALAVQAAMPAMSLATADFIVPEIWQTERRAQIREGGTTFAPGEMIMLHAVLDHVGRDLAGTPLASYEIRLDIEVRDTNGTVLGRQDDAMRFTGQPVHSVPIRDDYFGTGVVTGFPLQNPGEYELLFRLIDQNRPAEVGTLEIVKRVVVN